MNDIKDLMEGIEKNKEEIARLQRAIYDGTNELIHTLVNKNMLFCLQVNMPKLKRTLKGDLR